MFGVLMRQTTQTIYKAIYFPFSFNCMKIPLDFTMNIIVFHMVLRTTFGACAGLKTQVCHQRLF